MKLVVQIPCYNEEKTLDLVLAEIPKKIKGVDEIEIQIIDDGSTDKTVEIAKKFGVKRIINHRINQGLGITFRDGVMAAIRAKADILVNSDGDNQYPGKYIAELVAPIVDKKADLVVADRQTRKIKSFSIFKKILQSFGSYVVRLLSGTQVPDAVSGFRAYSRTALLEINPMTKFSYCIDTIVQAGKKGLQIVSIPITVNQPTRISRLSKNTFQHVWRSTEDMLKVFIVYEPFKTFLTISGVLLVAAAVFLLNYINLFSEHETRGHLELLILASGLFICAIQMFALGILADLVSLNRKMTERMLKIEKENAK